MKPGDLLEQRYRLVRVLGRGRSGTVWCARNELIDRAVAVKVLHRGLAADADRLQRFFQEARACGRVRHPSVVEVLDLGQSDDGILFLVMELLEGEPLSSLLQRKGRLAIDEALALTIPLARGLAAAHAHGVLHRDLKPANVFLHKTPTGGLQPKILDFGISKMDGNDLTTAGVVLGTPSYMSPEQARATDLDPRTDVWSLGVMLFEMLAGRLPFPSKDYKTLVDEITDKPHPPIDVLVDDVPVELSAAIDEALAKARPQRTSSALAFAQRLTSVLKLRGQMSRLREPDDELSANAPTLAVAAAAAIELAQSRAHKSAAAIGATTNATTSATDAPKIERIEGLSASVAHEFAAVAEVARVLAPPSVRAHEPEFQGAHDPSDADVTLQRQALDARGFESAIARAVSGRKTPVPSDRPDPAPDADAAPDSVLPPPDKFDATVTDAEASHPPVDISASAPRVYAETAEIAAVRDPLAAAGVAAPDKSPSRYSTTLRPDSSEAWRSLADAPRIGLGAIPGFSASATRDPFAKSGVSSGPPRPAGGQPSRASAPVSRKQSTPPPPRVSPRSSTPVPMPPDASLPPIDAPTPVVAPIASRPQPPIKPSAAPPPPSMPRSIAPTMQGLGAQNQGRMPSTPPPLPATPASVSAAPRASSRPPPLPTRAAPTSTPPPIATSSVTPLPPSTSTSTSTSRKGSTLPPPPPSRRRASIAAAEPIDTPAASPPIGAPPPPPPLVPAIVAAIATPAPLPISPPIPARLAADASPSTDTIAAPLTAPVSEESTPFVPRAPMGRWTISRRLVASLATLFVVGTSLGAIAAHTKNQAVSSSGASGLRTYLESLQAVAPAPSTDAPTIPAPTIPAPTIPDDEPAPSTSASIAPSVSAADSASAVPSASASAAAAASSKPVVAATSSAIPSPIPSPPASPKPAVSTKPAVRSSASPTDAGTKKKKKKKTLN
jgi:serine/threonine-protein kinase